MAYPIHQLTASLKIKTDFTTTQSTGFCRSDRGSSTYRVDVPVPLYGLNIVNTSNENDTEDGLTVGVEMVNTGTLSNTGASTLPTKKSKGSHINECRVFTLSLYHWAVRCSMLLLLRGWIDGGAKPINGYALNLK